MIQFEDKVAFITGAAVGIGRAVALRMAEYGAKVVLVDVNGEKLISVKEELEKYTKDVLIFQCDVSDLKRVEEVMQVAMEQFGKIDILVNNAALWRFSSAYEETPIETWRKLIDINIMGVVHCTRTVLPQMLERGYGRIINVASVAGVYGNGRMTPYSMTKGAIISMTKALAKETTGKGVTVNSVSPGMVSDSSVLDFNHFTSTDMCYAERTGTDRENADLICFLASDNAAYISGENVLIDGCRRKI